MAGLCRSNEFFQFPDKVLENGNFFPLFGEILDKPVMGFIVNHRNSIDFLSYYKILNSSHGTNCK